MSPQKSGVTRIHILAGKGNTVPLVETARRDAPGGESNEAHRFSHAAGSWLPAIRQRVPEAWARAQLPGPMEAACLGKSRTKGRASEGVVQRGQRTPQKPLSRYQLDATI